MRRFISRGAPTSKKKETERVFVTLSGTAVLISNGCLSAFISDPAENF